MGKMSKLDVAKALGHIYGDYDYGMDKQAGLYGHYSDKGKLPYHPTFSNESAYATKDKPGGSWKGEQVGLMKRVDTYTPSQQMLRDGRAAGLPGYISRTNDYHEKMNHKGQYVELEYPVPYKTPEYRKRP